MSTTSRLNIRRAESAVRESKTLDFKRSFDPGNKAEWPELIKDFVALANSGGGLIVIGALNDGTPTQIDVAAVLNLDSATIADKLESYTGVHFGDFDIAEATRDGHTLAVIAVGAITDAPIAFTAPGTYIPPGEAKQKTAFSKGTATTADLRAFIDRRVEAVRKQWLARVRQVVEAPPGAELAVIRTRATDAVGSPTEIRLTDDPGAPVYGRLDPNQTHPFRQTELVAEMNKRLPAGGHINAYDVQCVRGAHKIAAKTHPDYAYQPTYGSQQYSSAFANWMFEQYQRDQAFFLKARERYAGRA